MAEGLANKEIAGRLSLSYETVRWYARQIYQKLNVSNRAQAVAFAHERGLLGEDEQSSEPSPTWVTLPDFATPFIGRKDNLRELGELIGQDHVRLLTITGPGGVGKTRLGVELSRQHASAFSDGVFFIPMSDPQVTLETFNETLHRTLHIAVDAPAHILAGLAEKRMLLLFDNFEQLVDQNANLATLLDRTNNLKILITSQAPVNLQQEWIYRMDGLSINDRSEVGSDAIALFVARAQQVNRRFDASAESDVIQELCVTLKGYPLAIELAATWVASLSCAEILGEVRQNMDLLSSTAPDLPERHRSMRAAFEHDWALLDDDQQRAMRRLAVFPTVFGTDAAKQVGDISLSTLASLVDRSLIAKRGAGLYQIHELIRQYALEKLQDRQTRAPKSNVALAMHALIQGKADRVTELADELMNTADDDYSIDKGFALALRSVLVGTAEDYEQSLQLGQSSLSLTRELPVATFFTLLGLSIGSVGLTDFTSAQRYIERALTTADSLRIPVLRNLCLPVWAFVVADAGDYAHAVKCLGYLTADLTTIPDWLRRWEAFIRLEEDLQATLDKEDFELAWQVGRTASLDDLLKPG